jgi:hypothetical protein
MLVRMEGVAMSKFPNEETERLYEITLDGCADEEIGTADGFGWYARVGTAILAEDGQGFVSSVPFNTEREAEQVFATIVTAALKWEEETGVAV